MLLKVGVSVLTTLRLKSSTGTVKPVLSDHAWAKKKWYLNRGGLLIEALQSHNWDTTKWSLNRGWSLNTGGHKSRFHCIALNECACPTKKTTTTINTNIGHLACTHSLSVIETIMV